MKSTKRKRSPDDVAPHLASPRLRSTKQPCVASVDEIVPETDSEPEREDPPATMRSVKQLPCVTPSRTQVVADVPSWWEWPVAARAREIWLPSDQDKSFPANSERLKGKSWFTLNNTIETPSTKSTSQPSRPDPVPSDPTDSEKTASSTLKVRLYPTKPQMKLLNKMFGTHRAIYNKLVASSRDDCYKLKKSGRFAKYRPISQKHSLANYLPEYHLEVPVGVMNSTFRDYEKALKSSKALFKKLKEKDKKTSFLELKFKSKKHNSSSIEIRARDIKSGIEFVRFFSRYFGFAKDERIKIKEELPELALAVRLQRTRDEKFYLCIPRMRAFEQTSSSRVCAIDPGVRSFITMYDPDDVTLGVDDANDEIF